MFGLYEEDISKAFSAEAECSEWSPVDRKRIFKPGSNHELLLIFNKHPTLLIQLPTKEILTAL
jgi:hypothetical protein